MQVAHRAAGGPPEMQVDQAVRGWDGKGCTRDGGELASWDDMVGGESHAAPLVSVRSRPPSTIATQSCDNASMPYLAPSSQLEVAMEAATDHGAGRPRPASPSYVCRPPRSRSPSAR